MMTRILAKGYLWFLLALLYSPILIIMIFSFTEAKVLGNWTGFSTKLYSSLFTGGMHHSLMNAIWNTFAVLRLQLQPLPCWEAWQLSASLTCAPGRVR